MCGFAGFVDTYTKTDGSVLESMGRALVHRGPDEQGQWNENAVGLVHRRLSIQDLSPAGAQPMESHSGRYAIAFNGEIYNFRTLRRSLESDGIMFRGHSDTEVMLAAIEKWGFEKALDRFTGMFAFAMVDRRTHNLYLVRDRMGEKPLYYGWQGSSFLFGSELKALRCHPSWQGEINRDALTLLLRHNFIPAPHTIYKNIFKLMPASLIILNLSSYEPGDVPAPERYWVLESCFQVRQELSTEEAADQLEAILEKVVCEQMTADVPLGAFLSGGIDSSAIVALMQKVSSRPVKTFSIGFREREYNEAEHAKAVAKYLGTEHTELYVSAKKGLDVIPRLPVLYDEPFADSSQIPTFLISQMTRQHVTVALSGDGGDELFCGYTRYPAAVKAWSRRNRLAPRLRALIAGLPPEMVAPVLKAVFPGQRSKALISISDRLREVRAHTGADSLQAYYRAGLSYWPSPEDLVLQAKEPEYALTLAIPDAIGNDLMKQLMWLDLNWYLPDDILAKVDRAAMACSLETRIPLLDRRVVEFVLGLPSDLNVQNRIGKQVLRNILHRHVPASLVDRPKQGFAVPLNSWLRTDLRDWAENLLSPSKMKEQGFFQVKPIRRLWQAHLAGDDHSFRLWGVLIFQAWLENQ